MLSHSTPQIRRWRNGLQSLILLCVVFLLGMGVGVYLSGGHVMAQEQPVQSIPNPQQFRALEQSDNQLSFQRAENLIAQANAAIQAQNYDQAAELLQEAFNAYNQRSNFHQDLSASFAGLQNRISEQQRELARQAAQRRDETNYELAVVYRAAGRSEDAVAQLVQVIASQTPGRDLGRQAYQQLFEIGFVDTPYEG